MASIRFRRTAFSNRCHDSSHWNRTVAHGHTHATAGYTRHFAHKPPQSAARPFTRVPSSHMPRVDARPLAFRTQRSARNSTLVLMARTRSTTTDPSRPSPSSPREPARSQCCGPRAGQASQSCALATSPLYTHMSTTGADASHERFLCVRCAAQPQRAHHAPFSSLTDSSLVTRSLSWSKRVCRLEIPWRILAISPRTS